MLALLVVASLAAPPADDWKTLTAAGVNPDDPSAVVGYLRKRTLDPDAQKRLEAAVADLGAEKFVDRQAASKRVIGFGPAAAVLLRQAVQQHPDPEVQHRASECLRQLDTVPHAAVAAAAVRSVVVAAPADAAGVLLGFLPAADDRSVAAAVRAGLVTLAGRDAAADPGLTAALTDPQAVRRAAAAVALVEGGAARAAALLPKVLAAAVAESEPDAGFQMLFALATSARQKPAVAPLVELLPKLPRGRQWQVEDFLLQLAGTNAPTNPVGRYTAGDPARAAWLKWWATTADGFDLTAAKFVPRTTGGLLLVGSAPPVESSVVHELGPDLQERWRLPPVARLADVRPLPDGRVHIGERLPGNTGFRVSVVEPVTGKVVRTQVFPLKAPNQLDVPYTQAHPLPGDGVLLVGPGEVAEYAGGKTAPVFAYQRQQKLDVAAACRLADGRTLVVVKGGPPHALFLDPAGAEIPDLTLPLASPQYSAAVTAVGADRVLVAEPDGLAEYDVTAGKLVWRHSFAGARMTYGVQRLPNGNTLSVVVGPAGSQVMEVTPTNVVVWTYSPPGSQVQLFRAFQR